MGCNAMAGTERPVNPAATAAGKNQLPVLPMVSGTLVTGAGIDVVGAAGEAAPDVGAWDWLSDFPQPASSVMPINATGASNLVFIRTLYRFRSMPHISDRMADGDAECSEAYPSRLHGHLQIKLRAKNRRRLQSGTYIMPAHTSPKNLSPNDDKK